MSSITGHRVHKALFLIENVLFIVAALSAFFMRFELSAWNVVEYPNLLPKVLFAVLVVQLCLYYNDLYHFGRVARLHELVLGILQSFGAAVVVLLAVYYVFPSLLVGRGVFFLMMSLFFGVAFFVRSVVNELFAKGILTKRVLVVGHGKAAAAVIRYLNDPRRVSFRLVGFLKEDAEHLGPFRAMGRAVGSYSDLFQTVLREHVETVVVALDDRRGRLPLAELAECKLHGIEVMEASKFWEAEQAVIPVAHIQPSWVIFSDGFRQSRLTLLLKEFGEMAISLATLVLAAPLMAGVAVAIRVESRGPILFRQVRVGVRGKIFTLYKFRSMRADAEADGAAKWAVEDDPRVTRVGRVLRKYRLDELPQLFNVIRGDMSLVGPRPERQQFVDELLRKIPCYTQRLAVKPGVTGLAQVRMRYGASVEDAVEKLQYDLYYVKHLSISLDFAILLDTMKVVLLGKGAR